MQILVPTLTASFLATIALGQLPVQTLALTGQIAPNGAPFAGLGSAHTSNDGSVTFTSGPNNTIWRWTEGGGLQLLASSTTVPPGVPSGWFVETMNNSMDDAGNTAFTAQLNPGVGSDQDRGIWKGTPGSLSLVAIEGSTAPGTGGLLYDFLTEHGQMMGTGGTVGYKGLIRGAAPGTAWGIWRSDAGVAALVARSGTVAPGTGANFVGFSSPFVNGVGDVIFTHDFSSNADGVWKHNGTTLQAILGRGPAPGFPSGTNFIAAARLCGNNVGQVAFFAGISGEPSGALWTLYATNTGGSFDVVATHGQQAPGRPPGTVYGQLFPLVLGDSGVLLFCANAPGACMYVRDASSTRLLHLAGTPAHPGTLNLSYNLSGNLPRAAVNARGQAIIEVLAQSATTSETFGSIVGYTAYSGLFAIAMPGTQIEVSPGDIRTVQSAHVGGLSGYPRAFNLSDSGRCAFHAHFTNGSSGVFVADFEELRASVRCPADFIADGFVTGEDFDAFSEAFILGLSTADFNADGFVSGEDFDGFTAAFEAGC